MYTQSPARLEATRRPTRALRRQHGSAFERWCFALSCLAFCAISAKSGHRYTAKVTHKTTRQKVIWSSDFHIAGPADVKDVLRNWHVGSGVTIRDESLSGHCQLTKTCTTQLKILNSTNGITLGSCPNEMKRKFWYEYRNNILFRDLDAFLVTYAIGLAEVFMSFDLPIIVVVPVRYEVGRLSAQSWLRLNENLRNIALDSRNTLAANNKYDLEYLKHFTGIQNVRYIPNFCGYTKYIYKPTRSQVLIGPSRFSRGGRVLLSDVEHGLLPTFEREKKKWPNLQLAVIRELYPHYRFSDLVLHPAVVIIPYANSVMAVIEYYRMGIPLFAPSLYLLVSWQADHLVMDEISWNCIHGACGNSSSIQPHPSSPHSALYDPNNLTDVASMRYWLQFSDFYQWPAVVHFESWDDLFFKLTTTNLVKVHEEMMKYNAAMFKYILSEWNDVLDRAFGADSPRHSKSIEITTWRDAVKHRYSDISDDLLGEC